MHMTWYSNAVIIIASMVNIVKINGQSAILNIAHPDHASRAKVKATTLYNVCHYLCTLSRVCCYGYLAYTVLQKW